MAQLFESSQIGKKEELLDLITNIEAPATPFSSMIKKVKKPNQKIVQFQAETYGDSAHSGVMDGADVSTFNSIPRTMLKAVAQKMWYNPAVSDFAEESEVAGAKAGEMARQKAIGLIMLKRQIERRLLCNVDCTEDNGVDVPNATRGAFKWLSTTAQDLYPVAAGFRPPSASVYSGTTASFTEAQLNSMLESMATEHKGVASIKGIVGLKLKRQISTFHNYVPTVSNYTAIRNVNMDAKSKALVNSVDRLEMDAGNVDLMVSHFLYTTEADGTASAYTPRSGLFLDLNMWAIAYTREPRIRDLEDRGAGPRAIIDAILALLCLNPRGQGKAEISADS